MQSMKCQQHGTIEREDGMKRVKTACSGGFYVNLVLHSYDCFKLSS